MRSDNVIEGRFILWQNYLMVNKTVEYVKSAMGDRFVKYARVWSFMVVGFSFQYRDGRQKC